MCVLGFVGFGTRLPRHLQGLLGRCDWTPLCFATLPELLDYTVQPDLLVCNGDALEDCACTDDAAIAALLAKGIESGTRVPLVVVGTSHFDVPARLEEHPVHVLQRPGTYYERFGHLVHQVLLQSDACCNS
jgi:hypothetical protein